MVSFRLLRSVTLKLNTPRQKLLVLHSVAPQERYARENSILTDMLAKAVTQARKSVNYAESDEDEDDDDVLGPIANNSRGRATKRLRVCVEDDSDDEFGLDAATQQAMLEDGMSPCMVFKTL
jgi:hypothetical protein